MRSGLAASMAAFGALAQGTLLDQALAAFGLRAHRDFNLMRPGQTPTEVACAVLAGFQAAFGEERPDMIVVQGDTTTAFSSPTSSQTGL